jgi:hypothetical protein
MTMETQVSGPKDIFENDVSRISGEYKVLLGTFDAFGDKITDEEAEKIFLFLERMLAATKERAMLARKAAQFVNRPFSLDADVPKVQIATPVMSADDLAAIDEIEKNGQRPVDEFEANFASAPPVKKRPEGRLAKSSPDRASEEVLDAAAEAWELASKSEESVGFLDDKGEM